MKHSYRYYRFKIFIVLLSALLLSAYISPVYAHLIQLPTHFYQLTSPAAQISDHTKLDTKQLEALVILIPDFQEQPAKNPAHIRAMQLFLQNNVPLPTELCNNKKNLHVTGIYFDWQDKVGMNTLKEPGHILASGLDTLFTHIECPLIIIALGRAGLVTHYASHHMKRTIPTLIELGTPLPKDSQYAEFLPNTHI